MIAPILLAFAGLVFSAHFSTVRTVLGLLKRPGWKSPDGWDDLEQRAQRRLEEPSFPVIVSLGRSLGTLMFVLGGWNSIFPNGAWNRWLSILTGLALLLALHLAGDFFPRLVARLKTESFFPYSLRLQEWITPFFLPFSLPVVRLRRLLERRLGWDGRFDFLTEYERSRVVEARTDAPAEDVKVEQQIIRGALDLDERRVREILTPRLQVVSISADATREEISRVVRETGYSRIPVAEHDMEHVVGVIHAKDVLAQDGEWNLRELAHPAVFVPESQRAADLLRMLRKKRTHMAMVIDEHGAFSGIVTMDDALELIVGEIRDESDEDVAMVQALGGGEFLVQGDAHLDSVRNALGRMEPALPPPPEGIEVDTIAGLVLSLSGRIPEVGTSIEAGAWEFTTLELDGNRISLVKLIRISSLVQAESSRATAAEEGAPDETSPSTSPE